MRKTELLQHLKNDKWLQEFVNTHRQAAENDNTLQHEEPGVIVKTCTPVKYP